MNKQISKKWLAVVVTSTLFLFFFYSSYSLGFGPILLSIAGLFLVTAITNFVAAIREKNGVISSNTATSPVRVTNAASFVVVMIIIILLVILMYSLNHTSIG